MYVISVGRDAESREDCEESPSGSIRTLTSQLREEEHVKEQQKVVARDLREKAFNMRISDLLDAKIFTRDNNMLKFRAEGVSQIAYDFSLHSSRADAHKYTVEWYERKCTPEGLRVNSSFLYIQCLNYNEFSKCSEYLYECCLMHLSANKTEALLSLLGTADTMLGTWKSQIMTSNPRVYETALQTQQMQITTSNPLAMRINQSNTTLTPVLPSSVTTNRMSERRASLDWKLAENARSSVDKEDLIGAVCTPSMSTEEREGLFEVQYCEMRCRFFESQAYVETKLFTKSMKILAVILQFCVENGAVLNKHHSEKTGGFLSRLMGMTACGGTSATTGGYVNMNSDNSDRDGSPRASPRQGRQETFIGAEDMNTINSLYSSAQKVYDALKQLLHMQDEQQKMLRNIAQVTQLDLNKGQGFGSETSFGRETGSTGGSPFRSGDGRSFRTVNNSIHGLFSQSVVAGMGSSPRRTEMKSLFKSSAPH
jgi:hypothetical protein